MPIRDNQFSGSLRLAQALICVAVTDIQKLKVKTFEDAPDVRMIVDADHHPTLAAAHEVGHELVVLEWKIHPIACGLPVRRVHVEERMRSIVALSTVEPGQVLHVSTGETLPCSRQILFNAQQVDGWSGGRGSKRLSSDLTAEGMLLQVEETGGALYIGEGLRTRHLLPLEDLP